jgi:hypothetical protein
MDEALILALVVLRMNGILCWLAIEAHNHFEYPCNREATVIAG